MTNQEKQEESSVKIVNVLPSFQTSHVLAMHDNFVCPTKGLVIDDAMGDEVHLVTSLGSIVPLGITPNNEVEELDNKEYSKFGYSTKLFEELTKLERFIKLTEWMNKEKA